MGGNASVQKPIALNRLYKSIATNRLDLFQEAYDILITLDGHDRCVNYKDEENLNRTSLMIACVAGYTDIVSLLIKAGANVNDLDDEGHNALMLASHKGYHEIVSLLLDANADVDTQTSIGETALIIASNNNHAEVIKKLVKAGANCNLCTNATASGGGNDAFTIALWNGYLDVAKALYKEELLNAKNSDGKYPLMMAAMNGHHECVKWLRKVGADTNTTTDDGYSALFYAANNGHLNCVEALIKGKGKADVNLKNKYGNTCLFKALENGHIKVIQTLINGGADVNTSNNHGITPIMQAAWSGKLECLKYLIDRKAQLNDQDKKGTTTITNTTASNTTITNTNTTGETALMKSAFKNTLVCLKVLLSSGARHDIKDKAGMLAIHHSCISGAKDALKALIERSVITIDDKDNHGNTPLMVAALNAHSKTAAILLQSRANINVQNNKKGSSSSFYCDC